MNNFWALSLEDFLQKSSEKWVEVFDIRTMQEVQMFGQMPNTTIHHDIYLPTFINFVNKLDKNKTYLIYCYHANRTKVLLDYMMKNWFMEVYELDWWIDVYLDKKNDL